MAELARGHFGKIALRQGLQLEARAPRAQRQLALLAGLLERNLRAFRQFAGDVVKRVGGQGGRALLRHVGGDALGDFEIEIGGFEQ